MPSRTLLVLAGWTAAATAATLTGLAAVQLIGDGITGTSGSDEVTSAQIEQQLDAARASASPRPGRTPNTARPTPGTAPTGRTPAPSATAVPVRKTFSTPGGTAIAACDGTTVRLLSWAPAQGYDVKSADPGPDDEHAEVKFEGPGGKVELRARCADGAPTGSWKQDG
ncbi:hypothetical protein ACWERY_38240 [Streptomyces sp. NPDC004082]|uniref:hypothetical protein n=1 Tax=unclassified Streptomyces TaxID=2593676 RepID=UPI0033A59A30